jgi:hypothetical protein
MIGMDVGQLELRQPVGQDSPGCAAVRGLGGTELAADVNGVSARVGGVDEQHVIVERLSCHDVHVRLIGIRVDRELPFPHDFGRRSRADDVPSQPDGRPVQAAVDRPVEIFLATAAVVGGNRIDDRVSVDGRAERDSADSGNHAPAVRDWRPCCALVS